MIVTDGGLAIGVSPGSALIGATVGDVLGQTSVDVMEALLTGITVTPSAPSVPVAATQVFQAIGTYSDGGSGAITQSATWSSSNPSVAEVSDVVG
jgi:hypothetical protein